jgi:putative Holliday junction resolvase
MGRIMAVDYGRKRVGIAVTDPMQMIANGLDTIASHNVLDFLRKYFNQEQVDTVVIGYPVTLKNEPSEAIRYVNDFLKKFEQTFPEKRYFLMDERFTSKMASQAMIDGGLKKKQRQNKAMVDKISATIILQSYMQMKDNFPNYSK